MRPGAPSGPPSAQRRALLGCGAAALVPALWGCAEPEPALNVGTIVFPGYELLFLAREKGWLPTRRIRLVELVSSTDNLRALADGKCDAITLTLDEALSARAEGVDLRIVAVLDLSVGADALMVRPNIATLPQLRGRRIGVEDSAMGVVMFDAVLEAAGLRVEDVLKVPYTAERSVAMFQAGQVDAAVTFEPWVSQLEESGALRLFDSRRIPNRIVDVLAVRSEAIARRAQAVAELVAGHFKALELWRSQPKDASVLMAARLQVDAEAVPAAFKGLDLPDAARNRDLLRVGGPIAASAMAVQRILVERRVLRQAAEVQAIFDTRFLPA